MATPKRGQKLRRKTFLESNTEIGGRSLLTNFKFIDCPVMYYGVTWYAQGEKGIFLTDFFASLFSKLDTFDRLKSASSSRCNTGS